jgi:hypothetical protein
MTPSHHSNASRLRVENERDRIAISWYHAKREFTTQDVPFCIQSIFQGTAFSAAPLNIELIGPCGSVGLGLPVLGGPRIQHVVRSPQVPTDLDHGVGGLTHQPPRRPLT